MEETSKSKEIYNHKVLRGCRFLEKKKFLGVVDELDVVKKLKDHKDSCLHLIDIIVTAHLEIKLTRDGQQESIKDEDLPRDMIWKLANISGFHTHHEISKYLYDVLVYTKEKYKPEKIMRWKGDGMLKYLRPILGAPTKEHIIDGSVILEKPSIVDVVMFKKEMSIESDGIWIDDVKTDILKEDLLAVTYLLR